MISIQTGYFGRHSKVPGGNARCTRTHYVQDGAVLCGYKPHKTMEFQWCSTGPGPVECVECEKKLLTAYTIVHDDALGFDDEPSFHAEFYYSQMSNHNVKDIVADSNRTFSTKREVERHVVRTKKLYSRFYNSVHSKVDTALADFPKPKNNKDNKKEIEIMLSLMFDKNYKFSYKHSGVKDLGIFSCGKHKLEVVKYNYQAALVARKMIVSAKCGDFSVVQKLVKFMNDQHIQL